MSVGVHVKRRRANPMRVAQLVKKAMDTESLEDIAEHVNLQGTTILRKLLSLENLPREVQDRIHWGTSSVGISFSVATEIARCGSDSEKLSLSQTAIEHHLSKPEVQAIVQRARREGCSVEDASKEILKLRPAIDRQYLYMGLLEIDVPASTARRNIRRNLASLVGPDNVLSVRCGKGRFSFVLNDVGANSEQALKHLKSSDLQSYINNIAVR